MFKFWEMVRDFVHHRRLIERTADKEDTGSLEHECAFMMDVIPISNARYAHSIT